MDSLILGALCLAASSSANILSDIETSHISSLTIVIEDDRICNVRYLIVVQVTTVLIMTIKAISVFMLIMRTA